MLEIVLTLLSFVVALIALIISLYSLRTAERGARNDVLAQVRDWGNEVLDILSDASNLCDLNPNRLGAAEFTIRRNELISRVSSLIERGRLFFPNLYRDVDRNPEKEGLRPEILDLLILSYEITRRIERTTPDKNKQRRAALGCLRKVFRSVIQKATDYKSVPRMVKKYEGYLTDIEVKESIPDKSLPDEIRILAMEMGKPHNIKIPFNKNLGLTDPYSLPVYPEED